MDATFFGRRVDKFGLIIAKDVERKEAVSYHFIQSELLSEYKKLKLSIEEECYIIKAVVIDGKRGLFRLLEDIPIQMCHFHMQSIITRKLTKKPKLQVSIDLKRIASYISKVNQSRFELLLKCWQKRYEAFLKEKSYNEEKNKWHYKHRRTRSAFRSLKTYLPYLFTFKHYPKLNIPTTTNSLDGGVFTPLKMLLKIHRGIGIEMKKKMIIDYLENNGK